MNILIVDGMGGGVGRGLAEGLLRAGVREEITLVGTNSAATTNMMKSGLHRAATGENAVVYNASRADLILGAIGIMLPNAMLGEISPKMAAAVAGSAASKVFVPIQNDSVYLAGMGGRNLTQNVEEAVQIALGLIGEERD